MPERQDGQVRLAAAAQRFADRLNRLFAEKCAPEGREYTLAEVSEATGGRLSVPYLSTLRRGGIAHPRLDKLEVLADFFGVDMRYFSMAEPDTAPVTAAPEISDELRRALENPWTRQFALRTSDMGPDDFAALMHFWEYSAPLRKGRRTFPDDDAPETGEPQVQEEQ